MKRLAYHRWHFFEEKKEKPLNDRAYPVCEQAKVNFTPMITYNMFSESFRKASHVNK